MSQFYPHQENRLPSFDNDTVKQKIRLFAQMAKHPQKCIEQADTDSDEDYGSLRKQFQPQAQTRTKQKFSEENQSAIGKCFPFFSRNSEDRTTAVQQFKSPSKYVSTTNNNPSRKLTQASRRVEEHSPTSFGTVFAFIITFVILILFIAFCIDLVSSYDEEIERKSLEIKQCAEDYMANNCDDPVEAMVSKCKELKFCSLRDPTKSIKLVNVIAQNVISIVRTFCQIGLVGGIVFLIVILLYLKRPTRSESQTIIKYD